MNKENKFAKIVIYIVIGIFIFGMLIAPFLR